MRPYSLTASLLLLLLASSCIKSDYGDCGPVVPPIPPQNWNHTVSVTDKNYSNAADFASSIPVLDETLPFSAYVQSLALWRHNTSRADYQVYNATLSPTAATYDMPVEGYPAGSNRITAIGNETVFSQTFRESTETITLHPDNTEYEDIYIGSGDVPIPATADVDIQLFRAKGALMIRMENINETSDSIYVTADNLYAEVDGSLNYSGETRVTKGVEVTGTEMTFTVMLAPTIQGRDSNVIVTILDDQGSYSTRQLGTIDITRNQLSGIVEQIDATYEDGSIVYVYTNGGWERVTPLQPVSE